MSPEVDDSALLAAVLKRFVNSEEHMAWYEMHPDHCPDGLCWRLTMDGIINISAEEKDALERAFDG